MHTEFLAAILSFIIVAIAGIFVIPLLERLKFGQTVRADGPKRHFRKTGTPTMGGTLFISAIVISSIIFSGKSLNLIISIFSMVGFGLIGFFDDYIKISRKRSLGLRANQKLFGQLLLAFLLTLFAKNVFPKSNEVLLPFFLQSIDLGIWFIPFNIFVIIGTVNSANIADGLDGLASGIFVIISFFYTLILLFLGMKDVAIFAAAITGGCLGFLIYNHYPAKVFMGDTGSLGLGGALAAIVILTRTQFYLIFFGMIFIVESLSVILQVLYFQVTGKRIFKMSPLHHHFELLGWSEKKVVATFWCFTFFTCLMGFIIFYFVSS